MQKGTRKNTKKNSIVLISQKKLLIANILLLILVIVTVGASYEIYTYTITGNNPLTNEIVGQDNNIFNNGTVTVTYTEGKNYINMVNATPISDSKGMVMALGNQMMDFTVDIDIEKDSTISYEVVAFKENDSTLDNQYIKLYLERSFDSLNYQDKVFMPNVYNPISEKDEYGAPAGSMVLYKSDDIKSSTVHYYRLRMWLDSRYPLDSTSKNFKVRMGIYAKGERNK